MNKFGFIFKYDWSVQFRNCFSISIISSRFKETAVEENKDVFSIDMFYYKETAVEENKDVFSIEKQNDSDQEQDIVSSKETLKIFIE